MTAERQVEVRFAGARARGMVPVGLDRAGDHLSLVGAHRRTRTAATDEDDDRDARDDPAMVRSHPNRHVLIGVPVDAALGRAR